MKSLIPFEKNTNYKELIHFFAANDVWKMFYDY